MDLGEISSIRKYSYMFIRLINIVLEIKKVREGRLPDDRETSNKRVSSKGGQANPVFRSRQRRASLWLAD